MASTGRKKIVFCVTVVFVDKLHRTRQIWQVENEQQPCYPALKRGWSYLLSHSLWLAFFLTHILCLSHYLWLTFSQSLTFSLSHIISHMCAWCCFMYIYIFLIVIACLHFYMGVWRLFVHCCGPSKRASVLFMLLPNKPVYMSSFKYNLDFEVCSTYWFGLFSCRS